MKEAYILIRCLVKEHLRVPRSTILEHICHYGGRGRSWTMPTMLLDGDLDGVMPFEEDFLEATRNRHALLPPPKNEDGWELWGQDDGEEPINPAGG